MKFFEKKIFSRSPFTQEAPSYVFDSVLNTPLGLLTIFAIGSILMFGWVLDTPLTCLKKGKNSKKPGKELFLETLQLRLRNNSYGISEKNSTEKWFSSQSFSVSFVRNPEAAIEVFYEKHLTGEKLLSMRNSFTGVFLWILRNS